jgi:hypothetical protein
MDFIAGLPRVGEIATILVVVDRFSKYATFIPAPKYVSAEETAQLFFKHVVKFWGVPRDIVSDRDSRFTGNFWTELFRLLGSKLSMSSSAHPESDGQTERFNGMVEEYLRHFVSGNQRNWVELLDVAQLCFNVQKSSSTNKSPFEIVTGQQPSLPHLVDIPASQRPTRAENFSKEWRRNIEITRGYLERAAKRMKIQADKKRRPVEFQIGEQVMVKRLLRRENKKTKGRDPRLMGKYMGPVTIIKRIGKVAYKLKLPPELGMHPVVHVSLLKPYHEGTEEGTGEELRDTKPDQAWKRVAEAIVDDRRKGRPKKRHQEYLVKWQGRSPAENTWERATRLKAFQPLIDAYHENQGVEDVTKNRWGRMSQVGPMTTLSANPMEESCRVESPSQVPTAHAECPGRMPRANAQCPGPEPVPSAQRSCPAPQRPCLSARVPAPQRPCPSVPAPVPSVRASAPQRPCPSAPAPVPSVRASAPQRPCPSAPAPVPNIRASAPQRPCPSAPALVPSVRAEVPQRPCPSAPAPVPGPDAQQGPTDT